ncbi:MAG: helix-turn-helix domain-containing protein [Clostridia bacterium]|jgi:transposase|nr:helix-turn-helix domain-containing protein [Clostridia bacterium]
MVKTIKEQENEARAMKEYALQGHNLTQIGEEFGVSRNTVARRLKLLDIMIEDIKKIKKEKSL